MVMNQWHQGIWFLAALNDSIHRENGGTLGMVPIIINPIYTLYSGYLLVISPLKGLLGGLNSLGTIPRVPEIFPWSMTVHKEKRGRWSNPEMESVEVWSPLWPAKISLAIHAPKPTWSPVAQASVAICRGRLSEGRKDVWREFPLVCSKLENPFPMKNENVTASKTYLPCSILEHLHLKYSNRWGYLFRFIRTFVIEPYLFLFCINLTGFSEVFGRNSQTWHDISARLGLSQARCMLQNKPQNPRMLTSLFCHKASYWNIFQFEVLMIWCCMKKS